MLKQLWIALKNRGVVGRPDTLPTARLNMTGAPSVMAGRCTACGDCAKVCPAAALKMPERNAADGTGRVPLFSSGRCIGCARCVEACGQNGLSFRPTDGTWHLGGGDEWHTIRTREGN